MKKRTKRCLIALGIIILIPILCIAGYVGYMSVQYYRIDDNTKIATEQNTSLSAKDKTQFTIATYNIGFGAYDHDFSFFMDSGQMKSGETVSGKHSRAQSEEIVTANTTGAMKVLNDLDADFYFLQEVDTDATRSYHINQKDLIEKQMTSYGSIFGLAFHSAYLLYPFHEPHGSVESGLLTLSRYTVDDNTRRQYPVDNSFITKFTDLDRCFVISRIKVKDDKELVLINSHMSAYDKGGKIREKQLKVLNQVLKEEYEKGNYVIVGGDFNHDIADSIHLFDSQQVTPEWVYSLDDKDLSKHYSFVKAVNRTEVPTCRSSDIPYEKGVNYTAILDGFLLSDNIKATAENIDTDFMYSDHNPVKMTLTLQ